MDVIRSRYLDLLRAGKDKTDTVKVLTGMRRTGKSTILRQFRDTLDDDEDVVAIDIDLSVPNGLQSSRSTSAYRNSESRTTRENRGKIGFHGF